MKEIKSGPLDARIMIVGEAPGENEAITGLPFVGQSGMELTRMLSTAGIARQQCLLTNVCHERPPGNDIEAFFLKKKQAKLSGVAELNGLYPTQPIIDGLALLSDLVCRVKPNVIIALGATALWATTGRHEIGNFRGSEMPGLLSEVKVVPTYHPASVLRDWSQRHIAIQDMRRARDNALYSELRPMQFEAILRPSLQTIATYLKVRGSFAVCDIETRGGQIVCIGIALSQHSSLCIPLMTYENESKSYYDLETELAIIQLLKDFLQNNCIIFHHGLFDCQYFARSFGFMPNYREDTMIMQHTAWPGLLKGLAFCSSMYCEHHLFWKEDGKLWDPRIHSEERLWYYNCEDCVRTFEVYRNLNKVLANRKLLSQYRFQMELTQPVFDMMMRGIKTDLGFKAQLSVDLRVEREKREAWMEGVLSHPLNVGSSQKMKTLFYEDFGVKVIKHRKTKMPTLDDRALKTIARKNPLLRPLIEAIEEIRSLGVFKSTFVDSEPSEDFRMRCSLGVAGTETFRFISSQDAFGSGMNLQNISKGHEEED